MYGHGEADPAGSGSTDSARATDAADASEAAAEKPSTAPPVERAHPLALRLYYELRSLSLVDRVRVLPACEERLPSESGSDKHELCRRALQRCRAELGRSPSKAEYATWRRAQPDKKQLPSDTQVRNAFDGWSGARATLGDVVVADVLSMRLTATGPRLVRKRVRRSVDSLASGAHRATREELIAFLQEWARVHPKETLTQAKVLAWGKAQRRRPTSRLSFYPTSPPTFLRVFDRGGWAEAVEEAGLTHRRPTRAARTASGTTDAQTTVARRTLTLKRAYETQAMLELLRLAAAELGPAMSDQQFLDWLDGPGAAEMTRHRMTPPGLRALRNRFGSWPGALVAAGIISPEEGRKRRAAGPYDEDRLLGWPAGAMEEFGCALSVWQYKRYRLRRLRADEHAGAPARPRVPSHATLLNHFGGPERSWSAVRAATLAAYAHLAQLPGAHRGWQLGYQQVKCGAEVRGGQRMSRSATLVRGVDCATADAQLAASLVADALAFPVEAVRDLYRLLKHDIASPSTARERFDQLGLLMELLFDGNGEYPTTTRYAELWEQRKAEGWPDFSKLSRDYGTWQQAVMAAFRFYFVGGQARVASSYKHVPRKGEAAPYARYSVEDVLSAMERFFLDHGVWPTKWEYEDWSHLRRTIERDDPRLPTLARVCGRRGMPGLFDSFEDAVATAQRRVEQTHR